VVVLVVVEETWQAVEADPIDTHVHEASVAVVAVSDIQNPRHVQAQEVQDMEVDGPQQKGEADEEEDAEG
jgi:hypothetical protein